MLQIPYAGTRKTPIAPVLDIAQRADTVGEIPALSINTTQGVSLYGGEKVALLNGVSVQNNAKLTVGACDKDLCAQSPGPMPAQCQPCVEMICPDVPFRRHTAAVIPIHPDIHPVGGTDRQRGGFLSGVSLKSCAKINHGPVTAHILAQLTGDDGAPGVRTQIKPFRWVKFGRFQGGVLWVFDSGLELPAIQTGCGYQFRFGVGRRLQGRDPDVIYPNRIAPTWPCLQSE